MILKVLITLTSLMIFHFAQNFPPVFILTKIIKTLILFNIHCE